MAYTKKEYISCNHIEYEFYYQGDYGSRGEKKKSEKATPLKIKEYNHWQQEKRVRRLIQLNFFEDDYYTTLKYKAGTRKDIEALKKDIRKFLRSLKTKYKRAGRELKFIYRIEIGKQGGLHVHMIINRIPEADLLMKDSWKRASEDTGSINFTTIKEENGFEGLAKYICKQPDEEIEGQLKFTAQEESNKRIFAVSTSRNLKRPEPVKKKYNHWTMRKILENGPKPTPGFFIDKDSIVIGVNPFNGYTYYCYRESRINPITRSEYENDSTDKHIYPYKHKDSYKA